MALFALGGILGGAATGAAATGAAASTATTAASAAQAAKLAQAAKAAQAAKFAQGGKGLAAMYGGNFAGPQGAVSPVPGGASFANTAQTGPDFWSKFEASQGRPIGPQMEKSNDMLDKLKATGQHATNGAGEAFSALDGRLTGMFAPSRSTNQWGPNANPGIAGMMRQLGWSFGGGYGGIGGGRR